jgi:hypothetical protein
MIGNVKSISSCLIILLCAFLLACTPPNIDTAVTKSVITANKLDNKAANTNVADAGIIVVAQRFPLQIGDYLTVEFIDLLTQTHSPITARNRSDHRQYITSRILNNELSFTLMGNFHEGLDGFGINSSGVMVAHSFGNKLTGFKILSDSEFVLTLAGRSLTYRYVGNLDSFIAGQTIAGKYRDNKGALYIFTVEGRAIFPNRSFQYIVTPDVFGSFDSFFEVVPHGDGTQYGFKFVNNELQLFKMGGPMGDQPEPNPFVTLLRIGVEESKP